MMKRLTPGLPLLFLAGLGACGGDDPNNEPPGSGNSGGGGEASSTSASPPGPQYFLRIDDAPVPPIVLDLDKASALALFGEAGSKDIVVLSVDSTRLLDDVLGQIQGACGTDWAADPDPSSSIPAIPAYDCSATPLGASFGPTWSASPELALVRLLTATPANADMRGTSLEDLAQLAIDNPDPFSDIDNFGDVLSESLGISRTSPFIATDNLVRSLQQGLLATHPAVSNQHGAIPVTLHDALNDLTPLASKLGPVGLSPWSGPGEHPGVLVPDDASFTTRSDALSPAFRMRVIAESHLRRVSGLDLSDGAGDMFISKADAPLSFDFEDPERLQITGITENPTIDLRFSLNEFPGVVPSCTASAACKTNYPTSYPSEADPLGAPVGTGTVWTLPPFFLEPIIARAGLLQYEGRVFEECYLALGDCLVGVCIGDPAGWTAFTSFWEAIVAVPEPQFIWELLAEIAQAQAHNPAPEGAPSLLLTTPQIPDIAEGAVNPQYTLRGVTIGMTADEIVAAMRPNLQSQAGKIADMILGRYWENNDALDFYYRRADAAGTPYLFFAAAGDLRPDPGHPGAPKPYTYQRPGFFSGPNLSPESKVSATQVPGVADTEHEKYRLPEGETTLYMEDDAGDIYEVRFYVPAGADPVEIVARPTRWSP
jgi:hypothetical protein